MELTGEHINFIITAFSQMRDKFDFVYLLNYAKNLIYGENARPFQLKHINYHCNPKNNKRRYKQFTIKKKSGATRTIHAPCSGLKAIQKCLNLILQAVYETHPAATGFVPGKSIVDNAKIHVRQNYVYNIDLKDFFPSIDQARVWARLQLPPFNLGKDKPGDNPVPMKSNKDIIGALLGIKNDDRLKLAGMIASLCCHEMEVERQNEQGEWIKVVKNVLPQGAPTSPTLTNIICQQLDFYLTAVAKRFHLRYSRYADDITFSSKHNVFQKDSEFLKELHRVIKAQNFHIKESKTRLQKDGYRQEVTGLLVNEKVNVQKRYIKQLRMWLYYWETYGYERAKNYFLASYKVEKGPALKGEPNMANAIAGKLDFLKMVKGAENETYLKLRERFCKLVPNANPINAILEIWEKEGIEKAMEIYYSNN